MQSSKRIESQDELPHDVTRPGNKLTALFGNVALWFTLLGAVIFIGWGVTVIFGGLAG